MGKPIPDHCDGLARLQAVVHDLRSPDGCPWDREQSHQSLVPHLIEEAYEAVEALLSGNPDHMKEELGDVLLQVVLHAEIAGESQAFDLQDIAHAIAEKLIRRHPHVYGDSTAETTAAVLTQWNAIKRGEKGGAPEPSLHGIGRALPALARAAKVSKKAASFGFDWPDSQGIIAKIREELAEVEAETPGTPARAEEIGDLLLTVASLARKEGLDPEVLCAAATDKFISRFSAMEVRLATAGTPLGTAGPDAMEAAWELSK
jgi:MazG family protein